jgi:CheY-like chemotaxis protein
LSDFPKTKRVPEKTVACG